MSSFNINEKQRFFNRDGKIAWKLRLALSNVTKKQRGNKKCMIIG